MGSRRPLRVTLFALAVLSLAGFNAGRVIVASQQAAFMLELGLTGPLVANALTGLAWAIGFGAGAIGVYRLRRWAWRWLLIAIALYQANLWLVRLAFDRSSDEPITRPADAAVSLLSILGVWLFLYWPRVRRVFA